MQAGEIVWFDDRGDQLKQNMVVLDLNWLCHHIIGPALAPQTVASTPRLGVFDTPDATATAQQLRKMFSDGRRAMGLPPFSNEDVDVIIELLLALGLCYERSPGQYTFPAALQSSRPGGAWEAAPEWQVYIGRRCVCVGCCRRGCCAARASRGGVCGAACEWPTRRPRC